jgi:hypothetical protein
MTCRFAARVQHSGCTYAYMVRVLIHFKWIKPKPKKEKKKKKVIVWGEWLPEEIVMGARIDGVGIDEFIVDGGNGLGREIVQ